MNWYFQLYSARNTPLDEALQTVAKAGYRGVEAYRENFTDSEALQRELDRHGLTLPSMHINIGPLRDDLAACIARAASFDCRHIVCPFLDADERPVDVAGWQALGRELESMATTLAAAGIAFAWHNHDFEFDTLADGSIALEHLLDNAPTVKWEIDVAWIVRAGADPAHWIQRFQSRLCAVHLKDLAPQGACVDEDGWADLGEGVVPWEQLLPALLSSPAQLYIAEHDNPADLERFARRSIATANTLTGGAALSTGENDFR